MYLQAWLTGAEPTLRPRTVGAYQQITKDHLVPHLGRIPLSRLQPRHVQAFLQELLAAGKSPKTVRNVHGVIHRALDQAVRWRLINVNVAEPKISHQRVAVGSKMTLKKVC